MQLVDFLRTRRGLAVAALGLVLLVLCFTSLPAPKKRRANESTSVSPPTNASVQIQLKRPEPPVVAIPVKPEKVATTNRHSVVFSVRVDLPPETNATTRADVAPFGRLLQCQLVNTLESSAPNTPIIGLVTEDLWHHGQLLVPAGTEVHATAQLDRVRERINASGPWILVFQSGSQQILSGIALDREFGSAGTGWGITDGSAGIRGEILRGSTLPEVKLFLATALSGAASGLRQTRPTAFGDVPAATAQNVGLSAAGSSIDAYAKRVFESIERDGVYVRVPAGKQFYVYVTQPIDPARAEAPAAAAATARAITGVSTVRKR